MSPVDKQLITRKAKMIEDDLAKLKPFSRLNTNEYLESIDSQLVVERLLERIIGRAIDINYHLLKEKYDTIPVDYFQSFILLADKGEITKDLGLSLARSSGLRNVLAHEYDDIDSEKVYESIRMALTEIPQYLEYVLKN